MNTIINKIVIPIKELKPGKQIYEYVVDGKFFSEFGNSQIIDALCNVSLEVERNSALIEVLLAVKGKVVVECDRCLEELELPIDIDRKIMVRFASSDEEEQTEDDDVMVLKERDDDIDLCQFVYDYICLSLPLQKVHPKGKCNPEMIAKLKQDIAKKKSKDEYSQFSGLKDLLNNNN